MRVGSLLKSWLKHKGLHNEKELFTNIHRNFRLRRTAKGRQGLNIAHPRSNGGIFDGLWIFRVGRRMDGETDFKKGSDSFALNIDHPSMRFCKFFNQR